MRAVQISEYGDTLAIKVVDANKSSASEGQVLIEVRAASLNPVDTAIRAGRMQAMTPLQFPVTLANANVGQLAQKPTNIDFQQAASLPLTAASAVQALVHHADVKAGQSVFIHGGSGGIGTIAIQVAKALGAFVATTASGDGIELVKQLGADEVIDYRTEDFATKLYGYDVVLNTVINEFDKTLSVLKPGGVAVSLTGPADKVLVEKLGVTTIAQFTQVTSDILHIVSKMIEEGKVIPQVSKVYSLDDVVKAFEDRESNSVRGKIVITIAS